MDTHYMNWLISGNLCQIGEKEDLCPQGKQKGRIPPAFLSAQLSLYYGAARVSTTAAFGADIT